MCQLDKNPNLWINPIEHVYIVTLACLIKIPWCNIILIETVVTNITFQLQITD